jgi:hypothetical protein
MIEKEYTFIVDFKVSVDDITQETVKRDLKDHSKLNEWVKDPTFWEMIDRQKRLLNALLENKEVFDQLLKRMVVEQLEPYPDGKLHRRLGVSKEEDTKLLEPVFAKLSEEDELFWREVIEEGIFSENTNHVWESIEIELLGATVTEM